MSIIRIVAHLMGDGHVNQKYLRYSNKDDFLRNQFEENFKNVFGNIRFTKGISNSYVPFLQIQKTEIIETLFDLSKSYYSADIEIPFWVETRKQKIEFIRTMFDDEGTVGLRIFRKTGEVKRDIHIASKSRKIIKQMKDVLLKDLNIKSNKIVKDVKFMKGKKYVTFVLYITGKENIRNFSNLVNFTQPSKKSKLESLLNSYVRK